MVNWTPEQEKIIESFKNKGVHESERLKTIPEDKRRYKCRSCYVCFDATDLRDGCCPNCGEKDALEIMCPLDHCNCPHAIVERLDYCPICGKSICPECGTHDVAAQSRITGYIGDVNGWNAGKAQELKDRTRVDIATNK